MLNDEQRRFVEENHGMIYKVINVLKVCVDEYYDAGAIGLCKGAEKYDPEMSKPATFLYYCIKNEILSAMRDTLFSNSTSKYQVFSYNEKSSTMKDECEFADLFTDGTRFEGLSHVIVNISDLCNDLTEREKEIVILLGREFTLEEVGKEIGCTRERIRQIRNRIRDKYQKRYGATC